jgi:pimeloyl-ACP methyl ester carboxylesterase
MATYVLVTGAWHGGWCYRDTAQALRAAGHTVFTPTFTGLGQSFHLSSPAITLETHVRDICGVIEYEGLSDVILCGHSYGGMVITAVADRMAAKLKALVYLDAFIPKDGDSLISLLRTALPAEVWPVFVNGFRDSARAVTGAGSQSGMMAPIPAEVFGIKAENRAWVDSLCRAQPLATFEAPALLNGGGDQVKNRTYILADSWDPSPFRHFAAQCEATPGWKVVKMPSSHDVMVDMPQELAQELIKLA